MLGHLSEAAAEAIGADALLARVAGYYHDIGKTEDARLLHREPAEGRQPPRPARALDERAGDRAHVKEGVELARKARLPEPIVAAIREHHGTKLIRYFYQKALTKSAPERVAGPGDRVPPPGAQAVDAINGILMIADAVEAASRTLIEPTPAKIRAMIQTIVDDCLRDGQFDDCDLTMRDLAIIVETLERTVANVYHHRIDYPGFEFNRETRAGRPTIPRAGAGSDAAAGPRPAGAGSCEITRADPCEARRTSRALRHAPRVRSRSSRRASRDRRRARAARSPCSSAATAGCAP